MERAKTMNTGVAKEYCLQLEFLSQRVLRDPTELAIGLDSAGNYLRSEKLLDGLQEEADVIEAVTNISEKDFTRVARKHKPDYKGIARLSLVDLSGNGGALKSHAVSELYQL